ncbi:hypothetical protein GDO81_013468 [Engystomops pustulosus]|uniref:Opioid growth factor receptor (OGFr) conserved domain-containing protein n=2 Tax=Engystomops pustulosus TaxID=76066 RepID=A0AAV7AZL5_ENGPU|nr:hypothetical protein GDO81_013468 [Engystomops pustulosus]
MFTYWDPCWNSDYDSTWEDEELGPPKQKRHKQKNKNSYGSSAARDMQNYRHGYRQSNSYWSQAQEEYMPNLEFYQNKINFKPNGVKIDDLHQYWKEDYEELEENHSFIQWLFPLREPGVNPHATPLTLAEIKMMKEDKDVMQRFLESYRIMLGFYGILLVDDTTGAVSRADNWKERFDNLNRNTHNNLRITRILKCLGEMGLEHFQAPLVRFFLKETICEHRLPRVQRSALDYFIFTVKNKQERRKLVHYAWENYKSHEPFIWGPEEKLKNFNANITYVTKEKVIENEPTEILGDREEAPKYTDTVNHSHNDLQQQEPESTENLDEVRDDNGPGEDSPGNHNDEKATMEVGSEEAEKHEDFITTIESNSLVIAKLTPEDNSTENKRIKKDTSPNLITLDNSWIDEKRAIGDKDGSGNETKVTKQHITEEASRGSHQQITEPNDLGKGQNTVENRTENEQRSESKSGMSHKPQLAEDNVENEKTEEPSARDGNENMKAGGSSPQNNTQVIQAQTESLRPDEKLNLLPLEKNIEEPSFWDKILSFGGLCCINCICTSRQ